MAINNLEAPSFKARYAAGASSGTPGEPLASGKVYIYTEGGTYNNASDQATVWTDKVKTSTHSQPITLDAAGEAEIWFDGTYDIRIDSSTDELQDVIAGVESSISLASSTATVSILDNGSFETDTTGDGSPDNWALAPETSATIAVDTTNVTNGVRSLKFDGAGSGGGTATSIKFNVTEGLIYSVIWAFYATHASTTNTFQIKWYNEADVLQSTSTLTNMPSSGSVPTSWTNYAEEVAAASGATQGEVVLTGIASSGSNLTEDAYFDGLSITPPVNVLRGSASLEPVIYDSSGNEIIKTTKTATAVNEITTGNAATGNDPTNTASGDDTNVGINNVMKGTGVFQYNSSPITRMVLGTVQASTSGTTIDFTSIPSWAKKITVSYESVSTDGTSDLLLRIGDSGGVEATGYNASGTRIIEASAVIGSTSSVGFPINVATIAAQNVSGSITITLLNSATNLWACGGVGREATGATLQTGGSKALSAALDRLQITTASADTFDGGSINILYEG